MTRYVEPATLGTTRQNHDQTCGVWRRPDARWPLDPWMFRCLRCKAVVPWSAWREEERKRFVLGGEKPERCGGCQ